MDRPSVRQMSAALQVLLTVVHAVTALALAGTSESFSSGSSGSVPADTLAPSSALASSGVSAVGLLLAGSSLPSSELAPASMSSSEPVTSTGLAQPTPSPVHLGDRTPTLPRPETFDPPQRSLPPVFMSRSNMVAEMGCFHYTATCPGLRKAHEVVTVPHARALAMTGTRPCQVCYHGIRPASWD